MNKKETAILVKGKTERNNFFPSNFFHAFKFNTEITIQ